MAPVIPPRLPAAECFHPCSALFVCGGEAVEGGVFDSGAGAGASEEVADGFEAYLEIPDEDAGEAAEKKDGILDNGRIERCSMNSRLAEISMP